MEDIFKFFPTRTFCSASAWQFVPVGERSWKTCGEQLETKTKQRLLVTLLLVQTQETRTISSLTKVWLVAVEQQVTKRQNMEVNYEKWTRSLQNVSP